MLLRPSALSGNTLTGKRPAPPIRARAMRRVLSQVRAGDAAPPTELEAKIAATKVTVFSAKRYVLDFLEAPMSAVFSEVNYVEATSDPITARLAEGSDVVMLFVNDLADEGTIKVFADAGVKLIAMRCAGYDRVDLSAAAKYGLTVVRVPTYSPTSVAEHMLALLLSHARSVHHAHTRVMVGNYALNGLIGFELFGKTAAVLGTGAIGYHAARLLTGIGLKVLCYDIRENPDVLALKGASYATMEECLAQADIVSLHLPLLPSTYHFIDKPKIDSMKDGAILINVSRGALTDVDALIYGLQTNKLGGVLLDVYEGEGALVFEDWTQYAASQRMKFWDPKFKLLLSYPQSLFTPHSAFLTTEALENIADTTVQNIKDFVSGVELKNVVKVSPIPAQK